MWLLLGLHGAALAGDCRVPSEYGTLQYAVTKCPTGDEILLEAEYTYLLDSRIVVIGRDLTIRGDGYRPQVPALYTTDVAIVLESLTLSAYDGLSNDLSAALWVDGGSVVVRDTDLTSTALAGIVAVNADATLERVTAADFYELSPVTISSDGLASTTASLSECVFETNRVSAVVLYQVDASVLDSTFRGNAATAAADIFAWGNGHQTLLVDGGSFADSSASGSSESGGGSMGVVDMSLEVSDSTFTNVVADGPGGAIYAASSASPLPIALEDVVITDAMSSTDGGALYLYGDVFAERVTITDAYAGEVGGGAYFYGGSAIVSDSRFENVRGGYGGGGLAFAGTAGTVLDCAFVDGQGAQGGGAIAAGEASLVVERTTFSAPSYRSGAGAGLSLIATEATLVDVQFANLSAEYGAAIHADGSTVELSGGTFERLTASYGGAVVATGSELTIADAVVQDVRATTQGGFAWVTDGSTAIRGSAFERVSATGDGAVLYSDSTWGLDLRDSRVCEGSGASALFVRGGQEQVDIRNNAFLLDGSTDGAIVMAVTTLPVQAAIVNNTFAEVAGAGVVVRTKGVDVRNDLFHGVGQSIVVAPTIEVTGGYNLYDDPELPDDPSGTFPGEGAVQADPLFQGATTDCDANLWLRADSPARDAGDPDIVDSWGGRSDIGAYGGPGALLTDADADGVPSDIDCDDLDAGRYPGAEDVPEDGVDQDCDDKDAFRARSWVTGGGGCGCATGSPASPFWLGLLVLARLRRSPPAVS